jgi:flavin-dependent dehydrogenase
LVIDAAGRRSPLTKWTSADANVDECGMVYYSRYFRLRPGAALPQGPWLWGPRAELPFALAIVHLADRGVHSITFGIPTFDAELKILREERAFAAACTTLPAFAPWADPARVEPIGDVLAMGGLQNVLRSFLQSGRPTAPRVISIGDALCHTNAAYGWGVALGFDQANALATVMHETEDPNAIALAYHARVWPEAKARWEARRATRLRRCAGHRVARGGASDDARRQRVSRGDEVLAAAGSGGRDARPRVAHARPCGD